MPTIKQLENDLINPRIWQHLYSAMPDKCKEVVDGPPDCLGIGKNKEIGWYILGSGQGPHLLWSEKGISQ